MDWTQLLSVAMIVLVVALVTGSVVQLLLTTFAAGDSVAASIATTAIVALIVLGAIVIGSRSKRWLQNPDHYW